MRFIFVIIALCFSISLAQEAISTKSFRRPATVSLSDRPEGSPSPGVEGFGGTGFSFWPGDANKFSLETKALRGKIFGRLRCVSDPKDSAQEICTPTTLFSFEINTYIDHTPGQEVSSLKAYLFSAKGSPLSLRIPFEWEAVKSLSFSTHVLNHDDLPQSWMAGEPRAEYRLIPFTGSNRSTEFGHDFQLSYAMEMHANFEVDLAPGTAYLALVPSVGYMLSDSLAAAARPDSTRVKRLHAGIGYSIGYQFGGGKGASAKFSGSYALSEVRGSRWQLALGMSKALSSLLPRN